MRKPSFSKSVGLLTLTAATLVAAVFICLLLFRNDLLYFLLKQQLAQITLSEKTIQISRPAPDEFEIRILSKHSSPEFYTKCKPTWSFSEQPLQFSGRINYQNVEADIHLGIPISSSFRSEPSVFIELTGQQEELQWSASSLIKKLSERLEGTAQTKLSHPQWGEFAPEVDFKWGSSSELSLTLKPSQMSSKFISLESNMIFKVHHDEKMLKGHLEIGKAVAYLKAAATSTDFRGLSFGKTTIDFQGSSFERLKASGTVTRIAPYPEPSNYLKNISGFGTFSGALSRRDKNGLFIELNGKVTDNLNSCRVAFSVSGIPQNIQPFARAELELFEGAFADLIIRDKIPGTKLLSGKLIGNLQKKGILLELEPTSVLMGDYLLTGIQGSAFAESRDTPFSVKNVEFNFAEGLIKLSPFAFDLGNEQTMVNFSAEAIQLKKILSNYPKSKLSGEGLFRGHGSVTWSSQGPLLTALTLENSTPGTISYLDPSQPYFEKKIVFLDEFQDLLAKGQQALVLKALENFHYTTFKVQAERSSSHHMKLLLNLKGKNPDLAKGQLFDIALPIEGDIESLVKGSLLQQPVADELNKRHIETE